MGGGGGGANDDAVAAAINGIGAGQDKAGGLFIESNHSTDIKPHSPPPYIPRGLY